jgi:orotate phosphoribosyltransferase
MKPFQKNFIELSIKLGALKFGEFTLKSGRKSPYFFNAGSFRTGKSLHQLGTAFAEAIQASDLKPQGLFGPAYKGIHIATATATALYEKFDIDLPVTFNRKEVKLHGEGGGLIGAPLQGKILIIDDVITAGTAKREAIDIIRKENATVAGVLIALDRQEKGLGELSAVQELERTMDVPVFSIVNLNDIVTYLKTLSQSHFSHYIEPIEAYRQQYGV